MVWDNWSSHKTEKVTEYLNQSKEAMITISVYSPWLNPTESYMYILCIILIFFFVFTLSIFTFFFYYFIHHFLKLFSLFFALLCLAFECLKNCKNHYIFFKVIFLIVFDLSGWITFLGVAIYLLNFKDLTL